jgi:hypothetical protein
MKPIVVYHPSLNGVGVSACDPNIITSRKVGVMMNTKFEKGRLKSEAWIEKDRADKVDDRIMAAVEASQMMELSTGVFIDTDDKEGVWNGEDYIGVARNYRPDHLALLPDQIGACSISDGAGFMRNADKGTSSDYLVVEDPQKSSTWHLRVKRNGTPDHNLMGAAWAALHGGFRGNKYEGPKKAEALTKLKALYASEKIDTPAGNELSDPIIGNDTNKEPNMNEEEKRKKVLVDALIGNAGWVEEDRVTLMALSEGHLKKIKLPAKEEAKPVANAVPAAAATKEETKPAVNTEKAKEEPKIVTLQSYIAEAPKEIQDVLHNSIALFNEEKTKLVDMVLANKNNGFTKEDLEHRPLSELRNLVRLGGVAIVASAAPNYAGQGNVPSANSEAETAMEIPVINFAK